MGFLTVELGGERPAEVAYDPCGPFRMLWVITNGRVRRNFLWVTSRKTGIYVAFAGPGSIHTSYHAGGEFHWKIDGEKMEFGRRPPLAGLETAQLIQSATSIIDNEALRRFRLSRFADKAVDRVVYLDNRMLPRAISYEVWAVPPFRHGTVPLMIEDPAHIHVSTHTDPWIQVVIYEQGKRPSVSRASSKPLLDRAGRTRR